LEGDEATELTINVSRSVITESCCASPTSSSRWFSLIDRAWATSSAASTSRSRSGSELNDSTGMPSLATRARATAPSIRLLMRLNCSRNIALSPPPQALQIAVEKKGLAAVHFHLSPLLARLVAGEQVAPDERPRLPPPRRELRQSLQRRGIVRLAAQDLVEDPLRLAQMALPQIDLPQRRRGHPLPGRL